METDISSNIIPQHEKIKYLFSIMIKRPQIKKLHDFYEPQYRAQAAFLLEEEVTQWNVFEFLLKYVYT